MAADFRRDEESKRSLLRAFAEEDPSGIALGYYEVARLALGWLAFELQIPLTAAVTRVRHALEATARQRESSIWRPEEWTAALSALDALALDLQPTRVVSRNLVDGFPSLRETVSGYQIAGWGLAQELADVWVVHPEIVCQRLALKFAEEAGTDDDAGRDS